MKIEHRKVGVVVAGGGVAGFSAAIASARNGAETLLIERYGFLGGMFTGGNMLVLNCMPPAGIGNEIMTRLTQQGYAKRCPDDPPNYPILHYNWESCMMTVAYDPEMAKIVLFQMAKEAGVKLLLHSLVVGTIVEKGTVKGVIVENKSGRQIVEGDIVIDATADGDVAASCGVPFVKGQTDRGVLFAMTLLVRLSHVNWPEISAYSTKDYGLEKAVKKATERGELPYYKPRTSEMVNYWGHQRPELSHLVNDDEALLWGGTVEGVDGTDVEDLTRAEVEAREQFISELNFLKKYIPGFQNAKVEATGVSIGVRDTRHIVGDYTLTGQDILDDRSFPDTVAYALRDGYPVNGIPYGCLLPRSIDGLLAAGNCIAVVPGSTWAGLQLGSFNNVKTIPTMWTTGEASGTAAALSIKLGVTPRALDVEVLRRQLSAQGALLSGERIEELSKAKLPSGKTVREAYQESLSRWKEYWRGRAAGSSV